MSNNINLASNWSRGAYHHEFETLQGSILVGNNQAVGSPTISQTKDGVNYPNVQAAINDLMAMYTVSVNSVIITTDGISPAGASQNDEFKFSGTVALNGKPVGTELNFDFFGFPVVVRVGETGEEVAAKVKTKLEDAMSRNFVINAVNFGGTLDILQVRYNDFQEHQLQDYTKLGIKIDHTVTSPAKSGYGTWEKIGTQTLTLDGSTAPTTLYYFKRIS